MTKFPTAGSFMTRSFRTAATLAGGATLTLLIPAAASTAGVDRPDLDPLVPHRRAEAEAALHGGESSPVSTRLDPPQSHTRILESLVKLTLEMWKQLLEQFPPPEIKLSEELNQSQQPRIRR